MLLPRKEALPMTEATAKKSKTKRILLLVVGLVLAVLIALGCVVLFVPGFWHPIGFFPRYSGILDSPIEEITLSRRGGFGDLFR